MAVTKKRTETNGFVRTDVFDGDRLIGWVDHHGSTLDPTTCRNGRPWPYPVHMDDEEYPKPMTMDLAVEFIATWSSGDCDLSTPTTKEQ